MTRRSCTSDDFTDRRLETARLPRRWETTTRSTSRLRATTCNGVRRARRTTSGRTAGSPASTPREAAPASPRRCWLRCWPAAPW